jgi:hypothetical protein
MNAWALIYAFKPHGCIKQIINLVQICRLVNIATMSIEYSGLVAPAEVGWFATNAGPIQPFTLFGIYALNI